jgi:hypothetical protein
MPYLNNKGLPGEPGWYRVRRNGGAPQTVEVFRSGHDDETGEDKLWISISKGEQDLLRVHSPQLTWVGPAEESEYQASRAGGDDDAYQSLVSRVEDCLDMLARNGLPGDSRDAHEVALLAELLHARLIRVNNELAVEAEADALTSESED